MQLLFILIVEYTEQIVGATELYVWLGATSVYLVSELL